MQYVFIFQALLEHYLYGDTELEVTSLESHLAKLYAPSPGAGCSGLEAEFKVSLCVFFFVYSSKEPVILFDPLVIMPPHLNCRYFKSYVLNCNLSISRN